MARETSALVLGFAARLPPSDIRPFVTSLRATGYSGHIALVVAQYDDASFQELARIVDFAVRVDDEYSSPPRELIAALGFIRAVRFLRRAYPLAFMTACRAGPEQTALTRWEALEFALEGLQTLRYKHYYDIIHTTFPDAEPIMVSDLRDVLFQLDPFSDPVAELELFLEDPSRTLGQEPFNRLWIRRLYGPRALRALQNETASCSGTVIGTRAAMLHYLKEMREATVWRRRPMGNHDQGVHNYLLHSGRLQLATVVQNGRGRVLTMGGMTHIRRSSSGEILNEDDRVAPVIHQYDRHPALADELRGRLAGTAPPAP